MKWLELRIPPLAVAVAVLAAMVATVHWLPEPRLQGRGFVPAAAAAAVAGALLVILGVHAFRRAHTTVNPLTPDDANRIVRSGVFRFSRNPMYLGMSLLLLSLALYQSHALSFAWVACFVAYLDRFQIRPEERALEARFGDEYRAYASVVRRWI